MMISVAGQGGASNLVLVSLEVEGTVRNAALPYVYHPLLHACPPSKSAFEEAATHHRM
jgi:hypothetical protein